MTQLEMIIKALKNLGGKAPYSSIYEEVARIGNFNMTKGRQAGIRKIIEDHSSDSLNYKGKDDLFYSVHGVGNGVWGLR